MKLLVQMQKINLAFFWALWAALAATAKIF